MGYYNIHYELGAAGFDLLLIMLTHLKKTLPTKENKNYRYTMYAVLISSCLSAIYGMINVGDYSVTVKYVAAIMANVSGTMVVAFYGIYAMSIVHYRKMIVLRAFVQAVIPFMCILSIATSPVTKMVFYYDDKGMYHPGPLGKCISIYYAIYIIVISIYTLKFWKELNFKKGMLVIVINALLLCSYMYPFINRNFTFKPVYIVSCLSLFIVYIAVHNPDHYIDIRTKKFNMFGFKHVLRERIDYKKNASCLIIRVNNYNSISRLYDDTILQNIQCHMAEIIENECAVNSIYHIGSSTFAIIMDNVGQVDDSYKKLLNSMPSQWVISRETVSHEYSYYKVSYPEDSDNFDEIMQRIHYARSDHKGHHKPGELIHLHDEALEPVAKRRMTAHMIESAIMYNTLEINFQPIYSLKKNKITSLEVLSRLKDEDRNYINPEYFIHVAEQNHTIEELSIQMFRKACDFAVRNNIFNYGIEDVNINLSPVHFNDRKLAVQLCDIAEEFKIPMNRFHFEITESELTNEKNVRYTLTKLKDAGAKIALDDFGTGFSNITSITHLPIDFVKIDKSLVWSYARGDNELLNELMPMIKSEGKMIIAEGIETTEHIDILERMCGDYLQGYYYSKPLPEEKFIRYLRMFNKV